MKRHALGPVVETFGPNIRISLALIIIGGFSSWLAFGGARDDPNWLTWTIFYCLAIGFGFLVVRHVCFRVELREGGVSFRGILGHAEIPWRDLDRIYVGAYSIHTEYVALGEFCRLRLITKQGMKYSIGERVHGAESLAELIHSYTVAEMARKAVGEFERGVELDFRYVRIQKRKGVTYRKWFAWHEIKWQDLTEYGFSNTHVNFRGAQNLIRANIAAEKVANTHVLEELLHRVRKGTLSVDS